MIESIHFKNFKVLRDTTLPLGPFTLIVGPNGSGKTTALQAFQASEGRGNLSQFASVGPHAQNVQSAEVIMSWSPPDSGLITKAQWLVKGYFNLASEWKPGKPGTGDVLPQMKSKLGQIRIYSLDAKLIAAPIQLVPETTLEGSGQRLAGVLDRLRDREPERFDALNDELARWLPEFDRVLFDTPQPGHRAIALRTREGHHKIAAHDVSQGTLLALAILTLAYIPDPPWFVGFEEPDRGIHPRLLRDVRDALYRLAYPQDFGEDRDPVQVVATTHSPYFVDLFRDHPEEIVIAEKVGQEARFVRLTDLPNVEEILKDAHLGDAWYSGILGGVPIEP